ncbi:MAG: hypothetical protein J6R21_07885, partial [Bacteroidales bacterium]|nr:hypothetical protein [Bacteroidales bacterium]
MSVTFINKYSDIQGGQTAEQQYEAAATDRATLGKSTVSLAGSTLHYDGVNVELPRKAVKVGTCVYADSNGALHFLDGASVKSASIPSGWE